MADNNIEKIILNDVNLPFGSSADAVSYSGRVIGANNVKDALDAVQASVEDGGGYAPLTEYGYFGVNYPKQMTLILSVLDRDTLENYPRLRFIHVSDSHGSGIGEADSLLENTSADFAVHTGDAVLSSYESAFDPLKAKMLACTKPFYLVLGNHDCFGSSSLENRYLRYIQPLSSHNGVTDNGKTYYSVNYTKSSAKFKCIFLDQADAGAYNNSDTPTNWNVVNMTSTQVDWLAGELQDAITNNRHVLIFMHSAPGYTTNRIFGWFDFDEPAIYGTGTPLMALVNAFKTGGSYTWGSTEYSFSGNGKFVGYFCGHTHGDSYGYLASYPDQFCCVTCRPYTNFDAGNGIFNEGQYVGTNPCINYFTVDYYARKLSLYRVGEQRTWQGTERVSFYIKY